MEGTLILYPARNPRNLGASVRARRSARRRGALLVGAVLPLPARLREFPSTRAVRAAGDGRESMLAARRAAVAAGGWMLGVRSRVVRRAGRAARGSARATGSRSVRTRRVRRHA